MEENPIEKLGVESSRQASVLNFVRTDEV